MTRTAAAFVLLCAPVLLLAQISPTDFARGADIRAEGGGSIFRVLLSDEVYDTVTRSDLADIRVLNAAGEVVPYALREAPRPAAPEAEWRAVPSFPMTEAQAGAAARTQVRIGADGTVLEVTRDPTTGTQTVAYLLDASAVEEPVTRMALAWEAPPGVTFLARVSVQRSDDLNDWRTVVASAALAQLRRDHHVLTQSEVVLPASGDRAKYFRISWPTELSGVSLQSVRVRLATGAARQEVRWRTLAAEGVEPSGAVRYDAGAALPIEYVDLEFPDAIDVASVTVRSRPDTSSPWVRRHAGVFYALQEGSSAIRSAAAPVARTSDRYWLVETSREGGWKPGRAPRLKVGWHPHELLFLARGAGPYSLVYGSARLSAADEPVDVLLAGLGDADRAEQVRPATIGASRRLGGDAALEPPPPIRRIVLWSVLVAAVALLALLAVRLFLDAAETH